MPFRQPEELPLTDRLFPILPVLRNYTKAKAQRDVIAAITVALFTIPQAMAYALIAGFPPTAGITTAIVASIVSPFFGSSEFLIDGPTNAVAAMLAANTATMASHGDPKQLVVLLTLIIGFGQCICAISKAGTLTRFVSEPVLTGFTAGAGIFIAVNQLPAALGLGKKDMSPDLIGWIPPAAPLFDFLRDVISVGKANVAAVGIAVGTIIVVRVLQHLDGKLKNRMPATFVTLILVSVLAWAMGLGEAGPHKLKLVRDIEPLTRQLPHFSWPSFRFDQISGLLAPAFAIGLLGSMEAIAISKSIAVKAGHRFDANKQLIGEGASNIAVAMVGGFTSAGSFARTAVNYEAGAKTRMAAIFSGLIVLAMILLFAPLANYIPLAALAGMLIHIGIRLINTGKIRLISATTRSDRIVLTVTFLAVLLSNDLAHALFFGVVISIVGAIRRAEGVRLMLLQEDESGNLVEERYRGQETGKVAAFDVQGELFFAAADELERKLLQVFAGEGRFVVVRLQQSYNMDHTFAEMLRVVAREAKRHGGRLILSGVRPHVFGILTRAGVVADVGSDAVFRHEPTLLGSTQAAIALAKEFAGEP